MTVDLNKVASLPRSVSEVVDLKLLLQPSQIVGHHEVTPWNGQDSTVVSAERNVAGVLFAPAEGGPAFTRGNEVIGFEAPCSLGRWRCHDDERVADWIPGLFFKAVIPGRRAALW